MHKSDRRSLLFLVSLFVIIAALTGFFADTEYSNDTPDIPTDSIMHKQSSQHKADAADVYAVPKRNVETFCFDPNTADSTTLLRLGLQSWQVRNIYKFRARGGVYQCKEDFAYVYGLTAKDYKRLAPYIRISSDYLPASSLAEVRKGRQHSYYKRTTSTHYSNEQNIKESAYSQNKKQPAYTPKIKPGETLKINSSDTTELKKIPGIGSYYARRIVDYRTRLGGYVSKEQLLEIDDFPVKAIAYINIDSENIKKININKSSLAQIKRHPYINYYQASAIVNFRRLHGMIKSISELRLMKEFSPEDLKRIEPYVTY